MVVIMIIIAIVIIIVMITVQARVRNNLYLYHLYIYKYGRKRYGIIGQPYLHTLLAGWDGSPGFFFTGSVEDARKKNQARNEETNEVFHGATI
jgi:hypothetical protein